MPSTISGDALPLGRRRLRRLRLRDEALAVKIAGLHVGQIVEMSIKEALAFLLVPRDPLQADCLGVIRQALRQPVFLQADDLGVCIVAFEVQDIGNGRPSE